MSFSFWEYPKRIMGYEIGMKIVYDCLPDFRSLSSLSSLIFYAIMSSVTFVSLISYILLLL